MGGKHVDCIVNGIGADVVGGGQVYTRVVVNGSEVIVEPKEEGVLVSTFGGSDRIIRGIEVARNPFNASMIKTMSPAFGPKTLNVFVAPAFPLPKSRTSVL